MSCMEHTTSFGLYVLGSRHYSRCRRHVSMWSRHVLIGSEFKCWPYLPWISVHQSLSLHYFNSISTYLSTFLGQLNSVVSPPCTGWYQTCCFAAVEGNIRADCKIVTLVTVTAAEKKSESHWKFVQLLQKKGGTGGWFIYIYVYITIVTIVSWFYELHTTLC